MSASTDAKRALRSAARFYAVQALFQMESSGQTVDRVRTEFETYRIGAEGDEETWVEADLDLFRTLVPDEGIITLHDTVNYREPCGVYQLMEEIRAEGVYDLVNIPVSYGTAIVRKRMRDSRLS